MSVRALMTDLARLNIRLEARGDRLRYSPKSAVTPELARRIKKNKEDLLAILRSDTSASSADLGDATEIWHAVLDRLDGHPDFPPEVMEGLRAAEPRIEPEITIDGVVVDPEPLELGPDGWPEGSTDISELDPCPKCGSLDQWRTIAGDPKGLTPGNWRCRNCDPPAASDRLAERAVELLRLRAERHRDRAESFQNEEDSGP